MTLTREDAVRLHRKMWSNMRDELGDNPSIDDRCDYKVRWCKEHFPNEYIQYHCFLCEYDKMHGNDCKHCPIYWGRTICLGCTNNNVNYKRSPISEILALPEREVAE